MATKDFDTKALVRGLLRLGFTYRELASEAGVAPSTIVNILNGKRAHPSTRRKFIECAKAHRKEAEEFWSIRNILDLPTASEEV